MIQKDPSRSISNFNIGFLSRIELQNAKQTIHDLKSKRNWWIKRAHTLDKKMPEKKTEENLCKNKHLANTRMVLPMHFVSCLLCHDTLTVVCVDLLANISELIPSFPHGSPPLSSCAASSLQKFILPKDNSSSVPKTVAVTHMTHDKYLWIS